MQLLSVNTAICVILKSNDCLFRNTHKLLYSFHLCLLRKKAGQWKAMVFLNESCIPIRIIQKRNLKSCKEKRMEKKRTK